jgi:hypothetical protein
MKIIFFIFLIISLVFCASPGRGSWDLEKCTFTDSSTNKTYVKKKIKKKKKKFLKISLIKDLSSLMNPIGYQWTEVMYPQETENM